jgi:hypothetical protein
MLLRVLTLIFREVTGRMEAAAAVHVAMMLVKAVTIQALAMTERRRKTRRRWRTTCANSTRK